MKRLAVFALAAVLCSLSWSAWADDRDVAVGMVKKAVQFYRANGAEKAIEEVGNPKGPFVDGAIYVYAMSADNIMLAHPMNPRLAGQNTAGVLDADGKPINKLLYDGVGNAGSGWIEYRYKNPKTGEIEPKVAYIEKADDLYFVCGFYKK